MNSNSFRKLVLAINAGVPLALLAYDGFFAKTLGANPVNFSIRTTGKLSLIFIVLTLAITPLRKLFSASSLIIFRRTLGLYAFFYAFFHLLIFYYFDRSASLSSTVDEIITRKYLWFGTTALVLMAPLAVTSANRMIQLLGAKRWQQLHRLTYIAAIAAVIHYYMLVKSNVTQPVIYGSIIGALLLYRLISYFSRSPAQTSNTKPRYWRGKLKVIRITQETLSVKTFRLSTEQNKLPFDYQAGQYLNISLDVDSKKVNRSYTIASSPTRNGYCELTIKREEFGASSRFMHDRVKVGDELEIGAPAGKFVFNPNEANSIVLIAGGVGITPLMSILRNLTDNNWNGQIHFIFCARTAADIIFKDELMSLKNRFPNLHLTITLSRASPSEWNGPIGRISKEFLIQTVPTIATELVYICGPEEMMNPVKQMLHELGVTEDHLRSEKFQHAAGGVSTDTQPSIDPAQPTEGTVTFARSNKSHHCTNGMTILEASEACGVNLNFDCRSGICGECKTRILTGQVVMETQDALTPTDRENQLILTCQAKPVGHATVDA